MYDIRHHVGIEAPQDRVYEMLATKDGLAEFWTHVEGDPEVGGKLGFFFGTPTPVVVMDVVELSPDDRVQWRCVDGPSDWVDTTVTFDLEDGLHCVKGSKWATFLIGPRSGLEGGAFAAFPDDTRISSSWR